MKKITSILAAIVFAVGLSAFSNPDLTTVWYFDGTWESSNVTLCPTGPVPDCRAPIEEEGGEFFLIYDSPNGNVYPRPMQ
jgi:hypothetical protein